MGKVLSHKSALPETTVPFIPDRAWGSIERYLGHDDETSVRPATGLEPPEWTEDANCLGAPDEWFYGDPSKRPAMTRDMATWVRDIYCEPCAVRVQCLIQAFERNEPAGIWGGFTKRGRDNLRRMIEAGDLTMADLLDSLRRGSPLLVDPEEGPDDGSAD
jgi:hypothetical protein